MSRCLSLLLVALLVPAAAATARADRASRRTPIVVAVEKARPSVVNIRTNRTVLRRVQGPMDNADDFFDQLFDQFFGRHTTRQEVETPLGSGVIIDKEGYVVTNEHVIRRTAKIRVSLAVPAKQVYDAVVICADPEEDVAVLKIQSDRTFQPIHLGRSSDIMLGETVIALGNPFGFENSVASGIVSAVNRDITAGDGAGSREYHGLIQTSALINPGNSGGPLVNLDAELIGVNAAVVSGAQGIGFAIPVDHLLDVLAHLFANPRVCRVWLGATFAPADDRSGAVVKTVEDRSPAATAGLKPGDRVVAVDGEAVPCEFTLRHYLARREPGGKADLRVRRAGADVELRLALVERPKLSPGDRLQQAFDMSVQTITPTLVDRLGLAVDAGVLVAGVAKDGPAAAVGLKSGDVIIQLDSFRVHNVDEAARALDSVTPGKEVYVRIVRGRYIAATRMRAR